MIITAAGTATQNDIMFSFGKAMSRAPIWIGTT